MTWGCIRRHTFRNGRIVVIRPLILWGLIFRFSSVGGSMADLTVRILGESNRVTQEQAPREAETPAQTKEACPVLHP